MDETTAGHDDLLLRVTDLKKHYPIERGLLKKTVGYVKAVDGVSFFIRRGETLGLVGESGCGKTTTGRCIVRAIERTSGDILFNDESAGWVNIPELSKEEMKRLRSRIQMIFQDPYSSLNPRMTIVQIVGEPLIYAGMKGRAVEERVAYLLEMVGLQPQ
ncbi:MAG: ATP-binding cassette domain-containing protein, partial [Anaerolineae bacterium]|nr:ATP-binding cassette domain-containing protein [Anaerolineae bacterium]